MSAPIVDSPRPDYDTPPVIETVLGIQFDRLPKFTNGHLGAFWSSLDQAEWPTAADAPFLQSQFERFTPEARWAQGVHLQVTAMPPSRLQITNRSGDKMIQVQNGRFHFNWLGTTGVKYPRYEAIEEGFLDALRHFISFVEAANVGTFLMNQWEITYINQIPKGTVWETPEHWGFFGPLRGSASVESLAQFESFDGEWHFVIPGQRGRLHVKWQHAQMAQAGPGESEIVHLTLTARGPLSKNSDRSELVHCLGIGRDSIVRTFRAMMSDEANKYWGLNNAGN